MALTLLITIIDWIYWILFMFLLARIVLHLFDMSPRHPVMRVVLAVTDPMLAPLRRLMGGGRSLYYGWGEYTVDTVPIVGLVALWMLHMLIIRGVQLFITPPTWLFSPDLDLGLRLSGISNFLFEVYFWLILLRLLLDWIRVAYTSPVQRFLWTITEPVLRPIRGLIPPIGGIDFSVVIALFLLRIVQSFVSAGLRTFF